MCNKTQTKNKKQITWQKCKNVNKAQLFFFVFSQFFCVSWFCSFRCIQFLFLHSRNVVGFLNALCFVLRSHHRKQQLVGLKILQIKCRKPCDQFKLHTAAKLMSNCHSFTPPQQSQGRLLASNITTTETLYPWHTVRICSPYMLMRAREISHFQACMLQSHYQGSLGGNNGCNIKEWKEKHNHLFFAQG